MDAVPQASGSSAPHNQEMAENVVDSAHFKYVHGTDMQPSLEDRTAGPSPSHGLAHVGRRRPGQVESHAYGFGISCTRFTGLVETVLRGCVVPLDDEFVLVRFTFSVRKAGGADITRGSEGVRGGDLASARAGRADLGAQGLPRRPALCDGDGEIGLFRRWCAQFYPEWYKQQAYEAFHGKPADTAAAE